ncbi:MAG: methyltransferase domain-containing protein [Deltaproteobacteria bacterium]|nr:MAG: methyltransferase domain-containing protein [Deltaproteobacteria bacterium]
MYLSVAMEPPSHYYDPYPRLAPFYDGMARLMLLPFGGEDAFRQRAIDLMGVERGMRLLELGCGTGAMTSRLSQRGVEVTAVDLSEPMLSRARKRLPGGKFVRGDILSYQDETRYDRVLLAFVLHEMTPEIRRRALQNARERLHAEGRIVILDFSRPPSVILAGLLRLYLFFSEPPTALPFVKLGLERIVAEGGFQIEENFPLAGGTTRLILGR